MKSKTANFPFFSSQNVYLSTSCKECHEIIDTAAGRKIKTDPVEEWNLIGPFVVGRAAKFAGLTVMDIRTGKQVKEIQLDDYMFPDPTKYNVKFEITLYGNVIVCTMGDAVAVIDVNLEHGKEIISCFVAPPELELLCWVLATDELLFGVVNGARNDFIAWDYKLSKLVATIPIPDPEDRYVSFYYWDQHLITFNGVEIFFCSLKTSTVKSVMPFGPGNSEYIEYLNILPKQGKLVGSSLLGGVVVMDLQEPHAFTTLSFNNSGSGMDVVGGEPMLIDMHERNVIKWYNLQGEEKYRLNLPGMFHYYPRALFGTIVVVVQDQQVMFFDLSNEQKLGHIDIEGKYVAHFGFYVETQKSLLQYPPSQKHIPHDIRLLLCT